MSIRFALLAACGVLLVQAAVLHLMGQPVICECGFVKIWEGVVQSSGNSQHLTDWYTFSHVLHGFLFYLVLWYFFPKTPALMRLAIAFGIEAAWEILENTPMVIEHYREQALAQGYVGDSILNSLSDTLFMAAGFLLAWRLPVWASITLAVVAEAFVLYMIRDGLSLNILGFFTTPEFIAEWQRDA